MEEQQKENEPTQRQKIDALYIKVCADIGHCQRQIDELQKAIKQKINEAIALGEEARSLDMKASKLSDAQAQSSLEEIGAES